MKDMRKISEKGSGAISPVYYKRGFDGAFGAFAFFLLMKYAYVWKWVEGLSLFLPDSDFFRPFMKIPGGMLAYAGSFLTQFLYYPVAGCLLFVALLYGVQRLTAGAFRIPARFYPCSFIPSLLLLTAVVNVGYTWATLKAPGHFFVPALGCILFLSGFWLYRQIGNAYLRFAIVLLLIAVYPLFGFYALFGAGLCLVHESLGHSEKWRWIGIFIGIAALWLVPRLYYFGIDATEQEISRLYVAGLPPLFIRRTELMLWMPFLLLFGYYAVLAFLTNEVDQEKKRVDRRSAAISLTAFLAVGVCTVSQAYENDNFKACVRSSLAIEAGEWQKAEEAVAGVKKNPMPDVVINGNLASLHLGKRLVSPEIPPVPVFYKDSRPGLLTYMQLSGLQMNYYAGQTNVCYRWAMELSVEFGWQVSRLKLLVKCALLNGEPELAQKYNRLLMQTLFHKEWARKYQHYIDHPERISQAPEFARLPVDPSPNRFVE